jgi:peroxiredoxin
VLLAFFPLAFSGTCTEELCEMRDDYEEFESRGVTIVPISVDHTYSLKEYKAKYNMKHDMLSDFHRDVSRLYGVLHDERFYSKRSYFLIDANGLISWTHVEDDQSNRREDSELLQAIDAVGG